MEKLERIKFRELLSEQECSGQSVSEFCASKGISPNTFYRLRNVERESLKGFARVSSGSRVELEFGNGVQVRVLREDLKAVFEALRCAQ